MAIFYTDSASFNSLTVTGSTVMSASSNNEALKLIGSNSTIFSVTGSSGGLFAVTDIASNTNLLSVSSASINIFSVDAFKNVSISGSLIVTGSITGSLFGSASYALTASNVISASYALTASYAYSAVTSSYPVTASGAGTAISLYSTTPGTTGNIAFGTNANTSSAPSSGLYLGYTAGQNAYSASNSNFIGAFSGQNAYEASASNFIGRAAGQSAFSASYSNFLGYFAGYQSTFASHSILLGYQAGYNIGYPTDTGIRANNIILGTNITLPTGTSNAMNIGGIMFASGAYSTYGGNPYSGSAFGSVGINIVTPQSSLHISSSRLGALEVEGPAGVDVFYVSSSGLVGIGTRTPSYRLDVSGSGNFLTTLTVTGSAIISGTLTVPSSILAQTNILLSSASGFPSLTASEALSPGTLVNIAQGGVRQANNNSAVKQAHGFVLAAYSATQAVNVYYAGINYFTASLVTGTRYFLGTAGALTVTPPTTAGQISQEVGVAISTTSLFFQPGPAIII